MKKKRAETVTAIEKVLASPEGTTSSDLGQSRRYCVPRRAL